MHCLEQATEDNEVAEDCNCLEQTTEESEDTEDCNGKNN
jgi:hypothetical protein